MKARTSNDVLRNLFHRHRMDRLHILMQKHRRIGIVGIQTHTNFLGIFCLRACFLFSFKSLNKK